ncbi:hypothetical protein JTB14_019091 [Gonioctena quinquepunctata]|nr:hypothetical protein JTB14_019091 [Gonioctena quinquepunctata]
MTSEKLISKVCSNFAEELEGRLDAKFNDILQTLATSVETLNKTVSDYDIAVRKIGTKADDIELPSVRNSLIFYGSEEHVDEVIFEII